jgi:hypothetical protein
MMRKILALVLSIAIFAGVITMSPVSGSAATIFTDISNHWAKDGIEQAVEKGYVSGYPDGTFRPNNGVTRAEFIKMIVDDLALPHGVDTKVWYQPYVTAAVESGVHSEKDFKDYNKPITRLEMARVISRALVRDKEYTTYYDSFKGLYNGDLPFTDYRDIKQEDISYLALSFGAKIISGYPDLSFGMDNQATRAEAAVMLNNFDKANEKTPITFQYLKEMKEVAEFGTNAETVSTMEHQEKTDLLHDVIIEHPNYTAVLKRVYIVPFKQSTSMYERKYISDRSIFGDRILNRYQATAICIIEFTPKKDGDGNLYASHLGPNTLYMYRDFPASEKFKFNNWYIDGKYQFKKGETVELSLYALIDPEISSLNLDYMLNGQRLAYALVKNPLK